MPAFLSRVCIFLLTALLLAGCAPSADSDGTSVSGGDNAASSDQIATDAGPRGGADTDVVPLNPDRESSAEAAGLLSVGDPAPPLGVSEWLKGEPIDSFEEEKVYVVEFWATWCGPCRTSMPHLSELQNEYGDRVSFLGISDEDESTVAEFLNGPQSPGADKTWDEVVSYRIGIDPSRTTQRNYMEAAMQSGIPTAFIVGRDGYIEWIGHPMTMDGPLSQVVGGDWDRQAARAEFLDKQAFDRFRMTLGPLLQQAEQSNNYDPVLERIEGFLDEHPGQRELISLKTQVLLHTKQFETALTTIDEFTQAQWDDGQTLNEMAWLLATVFPENERDLDLALRIALRASEVQEHTDGSTLDTVARVYYEQGNLDDAIKWQKQAVEHSAGNPQVEATLKKYEAEK